MKKRNELQRSPRHCDDYIEDPTVPEVLRKFLERARSPAHGHLNPEPFPILYATLKEDGFEDQTYRVTMASRLGDVGITKNFSKDIGYERRVWLEKLSNFRSEP